MPCLITIPSDSPPTGSCSVSPHPSSKCASPCSATDYGMGMVLVEGQKYFWFLILQMHHGILVLNCNSTTLSTHFSGFTGLASSTACRSSEAKYKWANTNSLHQCHVSELTVMNFLSHQLAPGLLSSLSGGVTGFWVLDCGPRSGVPWSSKPERGHPLVPGSAICPRSFV